MTRLLEAEVAVPACPSTLYITTARENLTPADLAAQPQAGHIFACSPGVAGREPYLFGA
jgi:sugar lactone lactonase YvrE